jgi:cytochrome b pre-mRNA-processing protein 3
MFSTLKKIFSPSPVQQHAYDLYVKIVEQARQPIFYKEWQVEDTVDGRFDVIVLHLCLVTARLEQETKNSDIREFNRYISEAFFADMDRNLREMGASDTGVGIRIKKMAQAFYGRLKAYTDTIDDETALADALARNAYREKPVSRDAVASLAAYMGRNYRALQKYPADMLMQGNVRFSN